MAMRILAEGLSTGCIAGLTSSLVGNIVELGDALFQKYCQLDDRSTYTEAVLIFLATFTMVGSTYYLGNQIAKKIDSQSGELIFKNVTCLCTFAQVGHIFSPGLSAYLGVCSSGGLFGMTFKALTLNFED